MKYVLVLLVVIVVVWVMLGRGRGRGGKRGAADHSGRQEKSGTHEQAAPGASTADATPAMVACIHCGLHLPRAEAVADAQGRLFCDDAHRLAGPR